MNEAGVQVPARPVLDSIAGKSAGTQLREAREAVGLHIGALAVSLKVPVKRLEALEADDLEQMPDAVFARALAATVCRSLKIDPEPVLARLPQLHRPPLQVGTQEAPVRLDSRGGGMRSRSIGGLPRPVVYLSALLLAGALVVAFVPSLLPDNAPMSAQAPDGVSVRTVPHQLSVDPSAVPASSSGVDAAGTAVPAAGDVTTTGVATTPVAQAAASAPSAAVAAVPAVIAEAVLPAGAAGSAVAQFSARGSSWVQVVDAAGLVHLRRNMDGGETVRINGTLPLTVVIGRADAVDLAVRGKPFDVQALAKDNVARFQIN